MPATTVSLVLGTLLTVLSLTSFVLNVAVLVVLRCSGLLRSKAASVYTLAFANILGNTLLMLLYAAYLGPAAITQSFLFPGGPEVFWTRLMGVFFHALWLHDLFIQVLTSTNRAIVVVFPHRSALFSRPRTIAMAVSSFVLGITLSFIANMVIPCCGFYLYYQTYAYSFLSTDFNYANFFLDVPLNVLCSVLPMLWYSVILVFVRKANHAASIAVGAEVSKSRRAQELKYAAQFSICTGVCIFIWITNRIFSFFLPSESPVYFLLSVLHIFHCSANSLVFLLFNKEVKRAFWGWYCTSADDRTHFGTSKTSPVQPVSMFTPMAPVKF